MGDGSDRTAKRAREARASSGTRAALALGLAVGLAAGLLAGCGIVVETGSGSDGRTGIDLDSGRYGHAQSQLQDGTALITGGVRRTRRGRTVRFPGTAERFHPGAESFSSVAADARLERAFHAAVRSDAGAPGDPAAEFVLVAGGTTGFRSGRPAYDRATRSVVRIRTGDGSFAVTQVEEMPERLMDLAGVALPDGRVVLTGGRDRDGQASGLVQIWDAAGAGIETVLQLDRRRYNHRAVFVPNAGAGWVLVTGGRTRGGRMVTEREVIDLDSLTVHTIGGQTRRQYHTLTYLDGGAGDPDEGAVIETGGLTEAEEYADLTRYQAHHSRDVEIFQLVDQGEGVAPDVYLVGPGAKLPERVFFHAAAAIDGRTLIVAGGFRSLFYRDDHIFSGSFIDSTPTDDVVRVVYDPALGSLSVQVLPRLRRPRAMHAIGALQDGRALITGGINEDLNSIRGAELRP